MAQDHKVQQVLLEIKYINIENIAVIM